VSQVFTHTDDPLGGPAPTGVGAPYLNGAGLQGVMGWPGRAMRGTAPTGTGTDPSDDTDILEIVMADPACPNYRVCTNPAPLLDGTDETLTTRETIPGPPSSPSTECFGAPGATRLVLITNNTLFTVQPATLNPGGTACGGVAAGSNGSMALADALPEWKATIPLNPWPFLYRAKVVRYMIAPGLDAIDRTPALWRSETGRYTSAGAPSPLPVIGSDNWQIIARGIEDLQVEYLNGGDTGFNGLWANNPGVIPPCGAGCTPDDYERVIRRVRVTLSARAQAPNLQGQTAPADGAGPNAVRGQLVSVITPRAAVLGLQSQGVSQVSRWQ
jgi:hypothetical protein